MRRSACILAASLAVLAGPSAVALADTLVGSETSDDLVGSPSADQIYGEAGNDRLAGDAGGTIWRPAAATTRSRVATAWTW